MDDKLTIDRLRGNGGGMATLLTRPSAASDAAEGDDTQALPDPADDYQAFARASNKPITGIHFLLSDQTIENFQYGELSSRSVFHPWNEAAKGNLLILRFAGLEAVEVLVSGRNLKPLFERITQ